MSNITDTTRFLQAVFPDFGTQGIFANLNPASHTRNIAGLDGTRDCYWSIAAFPARAKTNLGNDALHVVALVIDDVGTKVPEGAVELALGRPTGVTITSAGNYQWAYRLLKPVARDDWAGFFAGVERLIGVRLEARGAQTLMRLPMGVNTKKDRNNFPVRLVELNAGISLDPASIPQIHGGLTGPGPSGTRPEPRLKRVGPYLSLIPNDDVSYDEWMQRLHQAKALGLDAAETFEAVDAWSQKSSKYDPDETARRWDTVDPTRTSGLGLLEDAEAADPQGFAAAQQAEAPSVFDDGVAHPKARRKVAFSLGTQNQILATMDNAARALWGLGIECTYDEFHHRFYVDGERLTDHLVLLLRVEINGVYGKDFGDKHVLDAITALGLRNGFNPVTDMLSAAEAGWDGVARLDRMGPDYFHSEDTELARKCFRKVMIAAVRRARRPGVKFDQILVLESPEGWDKSTAWAVLAGAENFSDADILGKDARAVQEELADIWIHEIADLSGLTRAEVEHVKAFASRTNDRARPAYGKVLVDQPRQSIEVGTTNSDSYLMSMTGNRRFWPFKLRSRVDIAKLRYDRAQLWGEAAWAESSGETLVLDEPLWIVAAVAQEDRRVVDPWEDELMNLPDTVVKEVKEYGAVYQTISNVSIHDYLGGHRGAQLNGASGRKIAEIMKRLGWEKVYLKDAVGAKVRGYRRRTDVDTSVSASVPKNLF